MKNTIKLLFVLVVVFIVGCDKKTNTASEAENNAVDISLTKTDSTFILNLFYVSLKDIQIVDIQINKLKSTYTKITEESIKLSNNDFKLGKNQVLFIFKKGDVIDTIQKDIFNTLNLNYNLINTYKHHSEYFTEGLLFDESNNMMESMGLEGKSRIVFYSKNSNGYKVKDSIINETVEFGEGLAIQNNDLVQLLWKNNYLKIFDAKTKKHVKNLEFKTEGWGLCTNGNELFASNGTNIINVIEISGASTQIVRSISVNDQNGAVANINELEYVNGVIYANIWQSDIVCLIDPKSGDVIAKIDFSTLANQEREKNMAVDVLNGIAFNKKNNSLFITGKYWSNFYEISLPKNYPTL